MDDDSFVNTGTLWKTLDSASVQTAVSLVMGKSLSNRVSNVRVAKPFPDLAVASKWMCPSYMFNGNMYPPTVSGAGYLMDVVAAECMYHKLLDLPYFHLEDVFVTGFGSQVSSEAIACLQAIERREKKNMLIKQRKISKGL